MAKKRKMGRLEELKEAEFYKNLGFELQLIRRCSNISVKQVSRATGYTARSIFHMERGDRYVSAYMLALLANLYKININDLLPEYIVHTGN